MIKTRIYSDDEHRGYLELWIHKHGLERHVLKGLPSIGYIALDDSVPVAVAFLRTCEGALGIFEGLVTNPEATSNQRHTAINQLVERVLADARSVGISKILAYSTDEGVLNRSRNYGFKEMDDTLIAVDMGGI